MGPEVEDGLGVVHKNLNDVKLVVVLPNVCLVERHAEHLIAFGKHLEIFQLCRLHQ